MGRNLIQTIDKLTTGEKEWHLHFCNMKEKWEHWNGVVFEVEEKVQLEIHVENVTFISRSQAFIHRLLASEEEILDQYYRDVTDLLNSWVLSAMMASLCLLSPHSPGQGPPVSSFKTIQGSFPFSSKENTSGW